MGKIYVTSADKSAVRTKMDSWVFSVPPKEADRSLRGDDDSTAFCAKLNVDEYTETYPKCLPDVPPGRCGVFQFLGLLSEGKVPGTEKALQDGFTRMFLTRDDDDGDAEIWLTKGEEICCSDGVWHAPSEADEETVRRFEVYDHPIKPGEGMELFWVPLDPVSSDVKDLRERYFRDPVGFMRDMLGVSLTAEQEEIIKSLKKG